MSEKFYHFSQILEINQLNITNGMEDSYTANNEIERVFHI